MKRALAVVLVLVAFAGGLVVTMPSVLLVRLVYARLPAAAAGVVEGIGGARLGWDGLTLDALTLRLRAGRPPLEVTSLTWQPSLRGLLLGRRGAPWSVRARTCGGDVDGRIEGGWPGDAAQVRFRGLDLATCLAPIDTRGPLAGTAGGDAVFDATGDRRTGRGTFTVTAARWRPAGIPQHLPLDAEQATIRWSLDGDLLRVDALTLTNRELTATGTGTIRLAPGAPPELALELRVVPAAGMPQAHRTLLNQLPGSPLDGSGTRTFWIGGSLAAPQLGRPG
jgi:type II secretion system protein N